MNKFTINRTIDAPAEKVWNIAGDFIKSPGLGIVVEVMEKGNPRNHGAGAVRSITIGSVRVKERLESIDPTNKSFIYTILSGAPMKDHLAKAEFIPRGSSTEVRWNVQFAPKVPGIGWIVANVTKKAVNQYLDAVEKAVR